MRWFEPATPVLGTQGKISTQVFISLYDEIVIDHLMSLRVPLENNY